MDSSVPNEDAGGPLLALEAGAISLDVLAHGSTRTILVSGELDAGTSWVLRSTAQDVWLTAPGRVVISLVACTYCDERGIATIVWLRRRIGARLRIVLPLDRAVRRVFDDVNLPEGVCMQPPTAAMFSARYARD